jgi:hypothetical protein
VWEQDESSHLEMIEGLIDRRLGFGTLQYPLLLRRGFAILCQFVFMTT